MKMIYFIVLILMVAFAGCLGHQEGPSSSSSLQEQALEFEGVLLTPIEEQRNNGIKGTRYIDRGEYVLEVDGMVEEPLSLSYDEVLAYPNVSRLVVLYCVEGWSFTAKWTGVPLNLILEDAQVSEGATTVVFHCDDGYTTSLELDYILENDLIIAYRLNDVSLPPERGFPFQLVAEGKYGYKWAKWITRIEVIEGPYEGYWEERGYNNDAEVGGPAFG